MGALMKEVSCRVFDIFLKPLAAKGVPASIMVEGTNLTLAKLRDKHERVDWSEMCIILRNLRGVFSEEELVDIGRSYFRAAPLRFAFVVGRLLFTPMGFYRWLNKPREGVGNQMFTCVTPTQREISEYECEVDLVLHEGIEYSREFFVLTSGNFIEMPRLLGYPPAKVTLSRIGNVGRFHLVVPTKTRILSRIKRAITYPFTVREVAGQLKEAHESLQERYEVLESTRQALERKQIILDAAY